MTPVLGSSPPSELPLAALLKRDA